MLFLYYVCEAGKEIQQKQNNSDLIPFQMRFQTILEDVYFKPHAQTILTPNLTYHVFALLVL